MCLLKKIWDTKIDRCPTRIPNKIIIGQCSNKSEMLASKFYREKSSLKWFWARKSILSFLKQILFYVRV